MIRKHNVDGCSCWWCCCCRLTIGARGYFHAVAWRWPVTAEMLLQVTTGVRASAAGKLLRLQASDESGILIQDEDRRHSCCWSYCCTPLYSSSPSEAHHFWERDRGSNTPLKNGRCLFTLHPLVIHLGSVTRATTQSERKAKRLMMNYPHRTILWWDNAVVHFIRRFI